MRIPLVTRRSWNAELGSNGKQSNCGAHSTGNWPPYIQPRWTRVSLISRGHLSERVWRRTCVD